MKEGCVHHNVRVHWEFGLNNRHKARFQLPKLIDGDVRLTRGDELRLRLVTGIEQEWTGVGQISRLPISMDDDVEIEMKTGNAVPLEKTSGYTVELVWKSTSFDRMNIAMRTFAREEKCMSMYIYR